MSTILLIEDDDLFRDALAGALTERGYTVMQARDGDEGMRIFRVEPADLVLTDIVMPNKDGTALVTELHREFPDTAIIAMSGGVAHEPELYLKIAGAFGATRTLKKPFELPTLLAAIKDVLGDGREEKPPAP
jgi:DNA-binding response OmpR family regulator